MLNICVVVLCHNVSNYGKESIRAVLEALKLSQKSATLVVVDDGSTDNTHDEILAAIEMTRQSSEVKEAYVIQNKIQEGMSSSSSKVVALLRTLPVGTMSILTLPGNDQVDCESISRMFNSALPEVITIGYRTNRKRERPPIKFLASKILELTTRWLYTPNLRDITGLYLVPLEVFAKALQNTKGHAWSINVIYEALLRQTPVIQIPISIKRGFRERAKAEGFRRVPRLRDTLHLTNALLKTYFQLKRNKIYRRRGSRMLQEMQHGRY